MDTIKNQYNITPLTPSEADINNIIDKIMSKRHSKTIPDGFAPIIELAKLRLKQLETSLRQAEISNDNNTVVERKLQTGKQNLIMVKLLTATNSPQQTTRAEEKYSTRSRKLTIIVVNACGPVSRKAEIRVRVEEIKKTHSLKGTDIIVTDSTLE